MATFDGIIVAMLIGSVGFFLLILNRLFAYNRIYKFPEDRYTKLFWVLTKEHVLMIYLSMVIAHLLLGVWFITKI